MKCKDDKRVDDGNGKSVVENVGGLFWDLEVELRCFIYFQVINSQ